MMLNNDHIYRTLVIPEQPDYLRRSFIEFLKVYYEETHRKYHTIQHIERCVDLYKSLYHLPNSMELYIAIIFHDIIYRIDAKPTQNEIDSANLCMKVGPLFFPNRKINWKLVEQIILSTIHDDKQAVYSIECKYMMNFDLFELGTSNYKENAKNIKEEYLTFYSSLKYRLGRRKFLKSMLNRLFIYYYLGDEINDELFWKLEETARKNLREELDSLKFFGLI